MSNLIKLSDIPDKGHSSLKKHETDRMGHWIDTLGGSMVGSLSMIIFSLCLQALVLGSVSGIAQTLLVFTVLFTTFFSSIHFITEGLCGGLNLFLTRDASKSLPSGIDLNTARLEGEVLEVAKTTNRLLGEAEEALKISEEADINPSPKLISQCEEIIKRREKVENVIDWLKKQ